MSYMVYHDKLKEVMFLREILRFPLGDRPAKRVKICNIYVCSDKMLCVF
jgi:hypothetical protein